MIPESGVRRWRNDLDKEEMRRYKRVIRWGDKGGKISLDKVENIYIINNALVLLFEN